MSPPNDALRNESRVATVLAGVIVPTVIGSIFVIARLWTRCIITRNWGADDTFITIAWVTSLGLAVIDCFFVKFGTGHHQIFQTLPQTVTTLKLAFISRMIYQFILCMTKISICVFYLRVFQDRRSKQWVYAITGFVVFTALFNELYFIFLCSPVSNAWSINDPKCKSPVPSTDANAICNILADVFLMIFVIPRVVPLQMGRRQKISLLLVVSLGILVIAASIVRTVLVTSLSSDPDLTWKGYNITTWSTLEISTGLFCASAPCIRPLLRQIVPGFLSSALSSSGPTSKSKSKPYGTVTGGGIGSRQLSRRTDAYELGSNGCDEDRDFRVGASDKLGVPRNAFWVGKGSGVGPSRHPSGGDGIDLEEGRSSPSGNAILRTNTVSVTIEEVEKDGSKSMSGASGVTTEKSGDADVDFEARSAKSASSSTTRLCFANGMAYDVDEGAKKESGSLSTER